MKRELTYEPEPGETMRTLEEFVDRGRRAQTAVDAIVADTDWRRRPEDVDHDVMTCPQPICRDTRRRILARQESRR